MNLALFVFAAMMPLMPLIYALVECHLNDTQETEVLPSASNSTTPAGTEAMAMSSAFDETQEAVDFPVFAQREKPGYTPTSSSDKRMKSKGLL